MAKPKPDPPKCRPNLNLTWGGLHIGKSNPTLSELENIPPRLLVHLNPNPNLPCIDPPHPSVMGIKGGEKKKVLDKSFKKRIKNYIREGSGQTGLFYLNPTQFKKDPPHLCQVGSKKTQWVGPFATPTTSQSLSRHSCFSFDVKGCEI